MSEENIDPRNWVELLRKCLEEALPKHPCLECGRSFEVIDNPPCRCWDLCENCCVGCKI